MINSRSPYAASQADPGTDRLQYPAYPSVCHPLAPLHYLRWHQNFLCQSLHLGSLDEPLLAQGWKTIFNQTAGETSPGCRIHLLHRTRNYKHLNKARNKKGMLPVPS